MKLTSKTPKYTEFNGKIVKYRITYNITYLNNTWVEDATSKLITIIFVINYLSFINLVKFLKEHVGRNLSFELKSENIRLHGIGSYYNPDSNAESCRFVCLYNPLCKSYLFLPHATSCFLMTSNEWRNMSDEFIKSLNESLPKNLEHSFIKLTSSVENMHPENLYELDEIHDEHDKFDCYDNYKFGLCYGIIDGK